MLPYWQNMSIREKLHLMWGMRYRTWTKELLSLKAWIWRYNTAKSVADFEAEYDRFYESGYQNLSTDITCPYCGETVEKESILVYMNGGQVYHKVCADEVQAIN